MEDCRLSILAGDDLDGIFDYTYDKWGFEQACDYRDQIKIGILELVADPQRPKSSAREDL